jgi:DNA polymerase family A
VKIFQQTVVLDFEYEIEEGNLPNVLCMVAYVLDQNLQHVRTIRLWRGEFSREPPFDTGPDTLIVAYSAWAEMTCFLVLGWKFPIHIYDLHTAYLASTNLLLPYAPEEKRKKPRKRLADACRAYGIEGWEHIDKAAIAKDIAAGNWHKYGQAVVFDYCEEDVHKSTQLLRRQLRGNAIFPPVNVARVLSWSKYSAVAVGLIQARGMPIDMQLWWAVQENKAVVIGELLRRFDPSHNDDDPIYTPDGEWSYGRFEQWLIRRGVSAWPRLESGQLDIDSDAFRLMYHVPGVEELHALRDSIGFIVRARLPIGRDHRNRPSLFPFGTATGRNAHSKSLFNAHAGMRSFIVFPPDTIGVYLDWRSQEVGVVAIQSDDRALQEAYLGGDVYYSLARTCGFTDDPDQTHWKEHNPATRQRMKTLQLGINYGMGVPSLAKGLNRHPLIASGIIERHKRTHPRFWQWRDEAVLTAMLERRVESVSAWPLRITTSPNKRTLYNFYPQSGGAAMLQLAAVRLCEAGIVPSMLIHDGILLEVTDREQIEHAKEIMRAAGRDVCDSFEIGVDVDQMLVGGARYTDKRPMAKKMWRTMMSVLEAVKAIPRSA